MGSPRRTAIVATAMAPSRATVLHSRMARVFFISEALCTNWGHIAMVRRYTLSHFAGHDEEWLHFEALVVRAQAVDVVLLFYTDNLLRGGNGVDGHVVVTAIPEHDEPPVNLAQEQVQSQVAIGHGDDGIDGVGIAAADEVAELL